MFKTLLLAAVLLSQQRPNNSTPSVEAEETGIIAGTVVAPGQETLSPPVQVILLSPRYMNLWNSDLQKRLDVYWERYKPAFATQKEFFFEVSRMAHKEATNYIVTRMRRDASGTTSDYLKEASPEGKFEFKNVPFGEYKVLAMGKIGNREVLWQESIDVNSSIPQFLELKKRLP